MSVCIVTGSAGLIGSESVRHFAGKGMGVVGIDNDTRRVLFGKRASTAKQAERLQRDIPAYTHHRVDIRDDPGINRIFTRYGNQTAIVIHAAAQPSHDWAASDPKTDFAINATGTLNVLEACRQHCPDAAFIFTSTNKVYGDRPNLIELTESETRFTPTDDRYATGIDETMSIDGSLHSVFGASKMAADVMVQEYGRYFGLNTVCFRGGCLTGPAHSGVEMHGFLSHLVACAVRREPYTVYGYGGKQVRDIIHSRDVVTAFDAYASDPVPGSVYNLGGGVESNCSVLEAIEMVEAETGAEITVTITGEVRKGDHAWYISDTARLRAAYPQWTVTATVPKIVAEMVQSMAQ